MDTVETIVAMYESHRAGEWEGDTPEDLVKRWANCRHAEVHHTGDIYIEDPQVGHYIDDDKRAAFVAWLKSEGIKVV